MKTFITICILSVAILPLNAQYFQSFLDDVNAVSDPADKMTLVDSFMNEAALQGFPYILGDTANFIYRASVSSAAVAGDFNGWDFNFHNMSNLSGTDFWYLSVLFEPNARLDYKIVTNGSNWILDPLNPNEILGGFGPNSQLAMPEYIQPWEIDYQGMINHGTIETISLSSSNTGSTFQIQIYLPPGYDEMSGTQYPVAYFQDGYEMISLASADNVLDNLIDSNLISQVIAVFVKPNNRNEEYAFEQRDEYSLFFAEELVPYIDGNYKTIADKEYRAVIGLSFGGNISALISYNHPEVFANCGLHSAAFWPNDYETYGLITTGSSVDVRYVSIWGSYEFSLASNMRAFRDVLIGEGYDFSWDELPEGHSWGLWRATLDDMLKVFFPPGLTAIEEEILTSNPSIKTYPNPASDHLWMSFEAGTRDYELSLTDIIGRLVYLENGILPTHGNTIIEIDVSRLAEGTYIYMLKSGTSIYSGKLQLLK